MHASGRNAGMIRRVVSDPAIAALARRGADLLAEPPRDLRPGPNAAPLLRRTGSILLAGEEQADALREAASVAAAEGTGTQVVAAEAAGPLLGRAPGDLLGLEPPPGTLAAVTPNDGVADPHTVLTALLNAAREHGAQIRVGTLATLCASSEGVTGVTIQGDSTPLAAEVVINAAGPWAAGVAQAAGGLPFELISYRRHLLYTGPLDGVDPQAPWIWDEEHGFYLRPESSGLLLCACDLDRRPPEDTQPCDGAQETIAKAVERLAPSLGNLPVARCWAGLRTFAPDDRFVIGPDPRLAGLFWLTGLGGHGLTTSLALADVIADSVDGTPNPLLNAFAPARFEAALTGGESS
jgi:glycine/D-amino acid oxidase-like deaminating enzyme